MKIGFYTDRHPDYMNRSGYIRTLLAEEMQKRGHQVILNPDPKLTDHYDFIICNEPKSYQTGAWIARNKNVPVIVICHDVPLDTREHELFHDTFRVVRRVLCVSLRTHLAVLEKWGDLTNVDSMHFGFDNYIYDNTAVRANKDHLIVFGDDAEHRHVKDAFEAARQFGMPIIRINGQDDYVKAIHLKSAFALIHPNSYGGFNIPPMEALYNEVPIIVSDIPVHREFYKGHAYGMFAVGDVYALVMMLKRLKDQGYDGSKGKQYAEEFTAPKMAERFEFYLEELLSKQTTQAT